MKTDPEDIILSIKSLSEPEQKIFVHHLSHEEPLLRRILDLLEEEKDK